MIRFEGVVHEYEGERSLNGVTLKIEDGEFVLVVGRNGSGKTTLLRHLNGLLAPDDGRVVVDGTVAHESPREVRKKVGLTFQDAASQVVAETVEDDIAFGPENLGLDREEIRRRVEEATESVGVEGLLDRSPYELSGGELRRVTLAGVLAMRPDVLAFDEPLAGLDYDGTRSVAGRVSEANNDGATVLVATHDPEPFLGDTDRVVVLDRGEVALDGEPEDVFEEGVKRYGVRPPAGYR